jgi:hypothetical protein
MLTVLYKRPHCKSFAEQNGTSRDAVTLLRHILGPRHDSCCLSAWRHEFDPKPIHVGFMENKMLLRQVSLLISQVFPFSVIPSMLHERNFGYYYYYYWGTRWRSWLTHCVIGRKIAVSIPDGVIGIFHWHNPFGRTMALGSTQPQTEMSTRYISWRVKAAGA